MSNSYTDKIAKELNKKLCCIKSDLEGQEPVTITYDAETGEFTLTDQFGNDTLVNITLGTFFYTVNTYNDLPDPVLVSGDVYWVSNSQGTYWLPGSLGGTYYPKGIYYSNGVSWEYAESPYEATLVEVNAGVNNNKFVTPYTFENSNSIVNLKQDVLDLEASAVPGGSTTQIQYNNAGVFAGSPQLIANIGVTNTLDIQGSGSTSATNALRIRNSSGTDLLKVRDDGATTVTGASAAIALTVTQSSQFGLNLNGISGRSDFTMTEGGSNALRLLTSGGASFIDFNLNLTMRSGYGGTSGFRLNTSGTTNVMSNTAASDPSMLLSGTGFSGGTSTTTKPTLLIEPTGTTSTGWSTSGTKLGVNAEAGFTGRLMDFQKGGASMGYLRDDGWMESFYMVGTYQVRGGQFISSYNTSVSNPALQIIGTGFSGGTSTTTKPTVLIEPTGTTSTGWSTSGTKLGVNAESGFTGNLINAQTNGSSVFNINSSGTMTLSGNINGSAFNITGADIQVGTGGTGGAFYWGARTILRSPTNGNLQISNFASNDFGLLQFGGVTSSFPAIARSSTNVIIALADATAGAGLGVGMASATGVNARAILEATSTSKGFLPPRMTTAQRDAVTWVAGDAGMMIFNSTLVKLQVWNGAAWETITSI